MSELDAAQSRFRSTIAFISSRSGSRQIWLIDPARGDQRQITTHPQGVDRFQWAPNGKMIAFTKRPRAKAGSHLLGDVVAIRLASISTLLR